MSDHLGIRIMRGRKIAATMVKDPLYPDWHPLAGRWTIHMVSSRRGRSHDGPIVANDGIARRRHSGEVRFLLDDQPLRFLPRQEDELDLYATWAPRETWRDVMPRVRVRFEIPGLPPFRAEKIWPMLDQLWSAGIREVDGEALSRML